MCGIFGWVSRTKGLDGAALAHARSATQSLAHRGPDHQGEWHDDCVFMGHRRLSIIDLTESANQPFIDASGRFIFSYNGEIYNYLELRRELEALGVQFRTDSDTEVFLLAYRQWGRDALLRFDGMFAGALHDRITGEHLLVRDPMGQKPLYYAVTDDGVIYASELRALLTLPGFRWTIDPEAVRRYLMLGYFSWDETPVRGIKKLLPGCVLRVDRSGAKLERYWDSLPGASPLSIDEDEAAIEFQRLFGQSCTRAMRSDVPYGVFLSGGIDSSLVLGFCRQTNRDLQSMTVAMSEPDYDESAKADLVNAHFGIAHRQSVVMTPEAIEQTMDEVWRTVDEPHGDPGMINAHFLARAARKHMVVALAGDGGDELFAGYAPFSALGAAGVLRKAPDMMIGAMTRLAHMLPASDRYLGLQFKALAFLQGFPASDAVRLPLWLSSTSLDDLSRLSPGGSREFYTAGGEAGSIFSGTETLMQSLHGGTREQQLLYYYQKVFLPEFVCMHSDRASMQSALEVRSPFLSPELTAFANRLPDRLKVQGSHLKLLLRRAARDLGLPPSIVVQPKQGFTLPLARWLKASLRRHAEAMVAADDWADGLIDRSVAGRFLEDHLAGRVNHYRIIYNLIVLRAWRRNFPGLAVG